jgi:hypothetical protein
VFAFDRKADGTQENLSDRIIVTGPKPTELHNRFLYEYDVVDDSGNPARTKQREVIVEVSYASERNGVSITASAQECTCNGVLDKQDSSSSSPPRSCHVVDVPEQTSWESAIGYLVFSGALGEFWFAHAPIQTYICTHRSIVCLKDSTLSTALHM